jgi:hypothetical protein
MIMLNATARVKKPTSRKKLKRCTLNGFTRTMLPATMEQMNEAAPMSSPMASEPEPALREANVENRSGAPLAQPTMVAPATSSGRPSRDARVDRFGQKKSDATMPRKEKRKRSQSTSSAIPRAGGNLT